MKSEFEYVKNNSKYVKVNEELISNFIKEMGNVNYTHWSKELNLTLSEEEWILLVFIIESMNFCFWKKPKWKIEYHDEVYGGSNALFFSVIKEVENNKDFLNIDYLVNLSKNEFSKIFNGVEGVIPLLDERYNNYKETVNFIYNNKQFYEELYSIKSDKELLNYIVSSLSSFNDYSIYKDKEIHFNKRATLLTNDLFYVSNKINQRLGNVNNLLGCADYGIPRTFRDYGILIYNDELSNLVDNEIEIEHDSDYEIEIRGCMLYVIERIKEELIKDNIHINSVELDNLIWNMGKRQEKKGVHHCTVTIYY